MKKGDVVTGISMVDNRTIIGEYDGKMYWGGEHIGYWIATYSPSYQNCPKEDYNKTLHEIKHLI